MPSPNRRATPAQALPTDDRLRVGGMLFGLLAGATLLAVAGCATPPPASDTAAVQEYNQIDDPLEPTNRVMYAVNDGLDTVLIRPIALAYRAVVPDPVRTGVHNLLTNLSSPVLLANDMMQGKPRRAGDTLVRFVVNSTVGVVGILDVAKDMGYPYHGSDFGMTLASWGVGEGPYLFLPLLGPSNPRDGVGVAADVALDPLTWVGQGAVVNDLAYVRLGMTALDARTGVLDELDTVKKQALDPYATIRSASRQYRRAKIKAAQEDNRATFPPAWMAKP